MLGLTVDAVRKLDARGHLITSKRDAEGAYTYERTEIEARVKRRGQLGDLRRALNSLIFSRFQEGRTLTEIVVETGVDADVVLDLFRKHSHGLVVEDPDAKREREAQERREQDERAARLETLHRAQMKELQESIDAQRPQSGPPPTRMTETGGQDITTELADRAMARLDEIRRKLRETG